MEFSFLVLAQILTAFSGACPPVLAGTIANTIALDPVFIGPYVGAYFGIAALSSVAAGYFVERLGTWGVVQMCVALAGLGLVLIASANLYALASSSVLLGLATGLLTPASSQILLTITSERSTNLAFSIRQAGTPVGYATAGLLFPTLSLIHGWQLAVIAFVPLYLGLTLAMLTLLPSTRNHVASRENSKHPLQATIGVMRNIFSTKYLCGYALLVISFSFMQTAMTTFSVVMLVKEFKFDTARAGYLFMLIMITGGAGRIFWGWIADRVLPAFTTLITLGIIMSGAAVALTVIPPATASVLIGIVGIVLGGTAMGWHGVVLAQIARIAGIERAGYITGGIMFLALGSSFVAPNLFSYLVIIFGDYSSGFGLFAIFVLLSCIAFRTASRPDAIGR